MTRFVEMSVKQAIRRFPALYEVFIPFLHDDNYIVRVDNVTNAIEICYPEDKSLLGIVNN